MFEVGIFELVVLLVVGLAILGPEKLPKVARTLGILSRKAGNSLATFKHSLDREIGDEQIKQPFRDLRDHLDTHFDNLAQGKKSSDFMPDPIRKKPED